MIQCSICYEDIKNKTILDCTHQFCLGCIVNYLKTIDSLKCPMCRASYDITFSYPKDLDIDNVPENYPSIFSQSITLINAGSTFRNYAIDIEREAFTISFMIIVLMSGNHEDIEDDILESLLNSYLAQAYPYYESTIFYDLRNKSVVDDSSGLTLSYEHDTGNVMACRLT